VNRRQTAGTDRRSFEALTRTLHEAPPSYAIHEEGTPCKLATSTTGVDSSAYIEGSPEAKR